MTAPDAGQAIDGRRVLGLGLLALAAFALAYICIDFTRDVGRVAAVWPVNALAVALLVRRDRGSGLPEALAVTLACLAANLVHGDAPGLATALAVCNGAEILVCVHLTRRWLGGRAANLKTLRDLRVFYAATLMAVLASTSGAAPALALTGHGEMWANALAWFPVDALGLLIVTPALAILLAEGRGLFTRTTLAKAIMPSVVLAATLAGVFGTSGYPLLFLCIPVLLAFAFLLGANSAAAALLVTAVVAVVATLSGYGPLAMVEGGLIVRLALLQAFLATATLVTLPVAAVLANRRRLTEELATALRRVEADEEKLALASQIASVGYWRRELRTGHAEWSDHAYAMHGLAPGAGVPDAIAMYHREDQPLILAALERAGRDGEPFEMTARLLRPDENAERIMRFTGQAERGPEGGIRALFGVIRDVTEEQAALRRIEESEAGYRLLAEYATDIVIKVDAQDRILYASPAVRRYGYEPDSLIGRAGYELVHPDDFKKSRAIIDELLKGAQPDAKRDRSYRLRTAAGDWAWVESNRSVVRDSDGRPIYVISLLRDVSDRIASQNALAESEERYRTVTERVSDMISRTGVDSRVTFVSPSVREVMGYDPEEIQGQSLLRFMHPDDVPPTLELYRNLIAGERPEGLSHRYRARHKDGRWIWLEANPTLVRDDSGAVLEFIDVTRDVSAQKALEIKLLAARDAAEAAAAVKGDFMANMSHEIRTPLTAILGFTSLLGARDDLPDGADEQVRRIAGAGQALLAIVNDVLDFSKLEAGQMPVSPRPVSPEEAISDALALFEPQAAAKGLRLDLNLTGELPEMVALDPDRLRQVLLNLIGNAVKFTQTGSVRLDARYIAAAQALHIEVRDTGPGIDATQQAKLFQRFSQVDASTTRRHGGTGLGLAICQGLVTAMGGEIGVVSEPGKGSCFAFHVAAPICEAAAAVAAPVTLDGLRVLVADDNPMNREIVTSLLAPFGVEVTQACDGAEAVEIARALPFDVLLLDVRMPVMDGPEAALRLRAEPGPNQHAPILAFSADFDVERLGEQGGRGFDGLVRKPIEVAALIAALDAAVRDETVLPDQALSN
jgi:PAS domain S-box-containing protein